MLVESEDVLNKPKKKKGNPWSRTKKWWLSLGPGIITAALVFGPGSLTVTSKLGASYGHSLLWVIVVATALMMTFTGMGARIGIATNQSLLSTFRDRWGKWSAIFAGIGIFLVSASFQAGNSIGAGIAFSESFGTATTPWIIFISLTAISLLFYKSFYKVLEKVMITMVSIMLISFIFTLLLSRPDLSDVAAGLVPAIPDGSLILVIALVASSFSIGGAFYQSYLVQEKGWKKDEVKKVTKESFTGIFVLGLISAMILMSAGAILQPQGIQVNAASDMGKALEPLYGNFATGIFMLGLFGASFSSLIGNATIGGSLFADALSLGSDLSKTPVKVMISITIITGALIAIIFGTLPLELIVFAQGVTIFIVPFIGLGIFLIANDKAIMGDLVNKRSANVLGIIGILVLFILAGSNFYKIFLS